MALSDRVPDWALPLESVCPTPRGDRRPATKSIGHRCVPQASCYGLLTNSGKQGRTTTASSRRSRIVLATQANVGGSISTSWTDESDFYIAAGNRVRLGSAKRLEGW
jgi:hypothetical protein